MGSSYECKTLVGHMGASKLDQLYVRERPSRCDTTRPMPQAHNQPTKAATIHTIRGRKQSLTLSIATRPLILSRFYNRHVAPRKRPSFSRHVFSLDTTCSTTTSIEKAQTSFFAVKIRVTLTTCR